MKLPVYVKIEDYKDVIDVVQLIKVKLKEAKANLDKINELKNREDREIEQWKSSINELGDRIDFIDKSLLEPEHI